MTSSRVIASSSSASRNSDPRQRSSSSISELQSLNTSTNSSSLVNAEITLLEASRTRTDAGAGAGAVKRTVDDVWREIVAGQRPCKKEEAAPEDEMMTLEDFLVRAGAAETTMEPPEVKLEPQRLSGGVFSFDAMSLSPFPSGDWSGAVMSVGGREKRRAILEPMDRAAEQRQRRMIKNRESAARSRERKQAYQVELESLAVKLEEENERLLKEKAARAKDRLRQLMERVVPVVEKRKPLRFLRRIRSMEW